MKRHNKQTALGYACSATLHTGLMMCVVWWGTPAWVRRAATRPVVHTIVAYQSDEPPEVAASWDVDGDGPVTPDSAPQLSEHSIVEPPLSADSPGLADFARKRLERARRAVEDITPEEQFEDLESLARRLEQVSSEQSVQELSGTLSDWLGAGERTTTPAEDANSRGADFDIDTAQISDVERVTTDDGVTYIAVLVDAQGNSIETPLDEADGPQLYKTFQLIKRFPLLESVYRKAVMGLLDKLAAETEPPVGSQPPVESERKPQPETDQQQEESLE